ncbi:MAG: stage III sporulation protein AD [Firmicutes bacterium]|nr:stage III sporulation protein AD [Bacillota bacterium]
MAIAQIILFAVVGAMLIMVIRELAPQIAFLLTLVVAIALFAIAMQRVTGILIPIERLAGEADVNSLFFATVIKIIGIAYLVEFGAQIARDAGVGSIAAKLELTGKLFILVLAIPIITAVVDAIAHLLP